MLFLRLSWTKTTWNLITSDENLWACLFLGAICEEKWKKINKSFKRFFHKFLNKSRWSHAIFFDFFISITNDFRSRKIPCVLHKIPPLINVRPNHFGEYFGIERNKFQLFASTLTYQLNDNVLCNLRDFFLFPFCLWKREASENNREWWDAFYEHMEFFVQIR